MIRWRHIVTGFIVLSLFVAPLGAAIAGMRLAVADAAPAIAHIAAGHADPSDAHQVEATAAMHDCPKQPAPRHDCPFCGKGDGCEAGWCLAKCFKVFGLILELGLDWPRLVAAEDGAPEPAIADWRSPPHAPPPRT